MLINANHTKICIKKHFIEEIKNFEQKYFSPTLDKMILPIPGEYFVKVRVECVTSNIKVKNKLI